jgi:recombination protein RecR
MQRFAEPMARLIDELRKLPGVGTKSAQRFAFHILRSSTTDATALADAITTLKQHLRLCSLCNNITDVDPCAYCTSPTRNPRLICVVEEPTNINAIEKTRSYNGLYHVLHGTLSPVNGIGPDQLRLSNLWPRLSGNHAGAPSVDSGGWEGVITESGAPHLDSEMWEGRVTELILAMSPTVEGEATARYLADELRRRFPALRLTRIATGVPAGSDIEYADEVTMTRALEGRRDL